MAKYRKLSRTSSQRKALLRGQVTALLNNGKIVTTEAKAKEVRKIAEGLIAMAVREKDNFEEVTVKAKVARKDAEGKRVKEVVDGKKVTVYDEVEKTIKKDMPSRLHARREMLKVLYTVTEVPTAAAGKKKNTKEVDLTAKLFDEIAPKYADRNGGYTGRMQQILIVEDDRALNQGLCKALKTDNSSIQVCSGLYASATDRQIVSCENLKDAKEQLLCGMPALVLLDINLPDGSGLDFLQSVKRDCPDCPVILLTANDTDGDIVNGLELGADDYITKPFSLSVLRARVNTQLRKAAAMSEKEKDNEHVYRKEPYVFDFDRMKFMVDGKEIELSKTEQKLLRILVENAGMNMRRELLLDRVWSDGAEYVDENALSVSVKRLRDKLGAEHAIRTVYGIGYRWE